MKEILCREITRRVPFQLEHLPWILKVYRYPYDRWSTAGKQGLYGPHNYLMYYLYKNFWPFKVQGTFIFTGKNGKKQIFFNPKNSQYHALYFKAFRMGYEPHVNALVDIITPDNGVFYDAGSNWGWFGLFLASRPGFQGRIHAFEAFPPTYADLVSMVEQTGVGSQMTCYQVALSDEEGMASVHLNNLVHSGCAGVTTEEKAGAMKVKSIPLDALGAEPPDVIKLDVEGFELKVLSGAKKLIEKSRPMIVFENHRDKTDPAQTMGPIQFLEKAGYVFYQLGWMRMVDGLPCLLGDDLDPNPQPQETLALIPFRGAERPLQHDLVNIFACHESKVGLLESHFRKTLV